MLVQVSLSQRVCILHVVNEIEGFFPQIKKKGLSLSLYHCDELAGKVVFESDADAVEALTTWL